MADNACVDLLERVVPFSFLRRSIKERLAPRMERLVFAPGSPVGGNEEGGRLRVYLIEAGSVEVLDASGERRLNVTEENHFFGEREALTGQPRTVQFRTMSDAALYALEREDFLALFEHKAFALAFGSLLRERQGLFAAFDRFKAELLRGVTRGHVDIFNLLSLYRDLEPALHPWVKDARHIDISAFMYAVRRLPDNVTRTFAYLLTDEAPAVFSKPDELFTFIPTAARRRSIWEMLPGKSLVLVRNGYSDIIDLVTCLCLYAVEARKIRGRLQHPEMLTAIESFLDVPAARRSGEAVRSMLRRELRFSPQEADGLYSVWGDDTAERIYELVRHREIFHIDVRRQRNNYTSRSSELWTRQIGSALRELLGVVPSALPDDVRVHIISSNTHSVINCLNPLLSGHARDILAWGERFGHELVKAEWYDGQDLVYALLRDYLPAHPELAAEIAAAERAWGIVRLRETPTTGIQVQLIDASRLAGLGIDTGVVPVPSGRRDLLVNIDYAFGEQAEHIIQTLVTLFGPNVASINFLGKAGALQGQRGDILAPTAFIKQSSERYLLLPRPSTRCIACLRERLPGRDLYAGPMLTVDGTLLQNRLMLEFYKRVWGCVGIEMEGAHYFRRVNESIQLGILREDVELRFYYYVSDLPMAREMNLATRLGANEGIPPLYAITREILSEIFSDG